MKIKKLEVCGFKSFVDRTVLQFDHDVTCIVGPNGCGKSNVVDAIRWVMGEQSAKNLRGKNMEDVIFNGSESRGPHSFAEVTITFDNSDGLAPPEYQDYAEIAVTRRLDRTGNSDYSINRTIVRLLDVTNLFLGTGVGRRAYSIIEQGKIGFIVSSRPEDRRHLIEEAAGITKFKARKKAAERKMEQTQQNLLRLGDIVAEIDKTLASLKRQAQKAERYRAYRAEVRDLELHVASHKWLEFVGAQKVVTSELAEVLERGSGARGELETRELEIETERLTVYEVEARVEDAQKQKYELDNVVRELEGRIQIADERLNEATSREAAATDEIADLEERRVGLSEELAALRESLAGVEEEEAAAEEALATAVEELEARKVAVEESTRATGNARGRLSDAERRIARAEAVLQGFERRRDEARQRLERLAGERERTEERAQLLMMEAEELRAKLEGYRSGKEQSSARKAELEQELTEWRSEFQQSDKALEKLRIETADKRSRLRSLEQIQQKFEGVGAGVRSVMTHYAKDDHDRVAKGVLGMLADRVDCPAEYTQALAGALGDRLQHLVVRDLDAASAVVEFLKQNKSGRVTLLPQSPRRIVRPTPALPTNDGVVGWLADLVHVADADHGLIQHAMGDVLVVETLEHAKSLQSAGVEAASFVTLEGELLGRDGALTGGTGDQVGAHMIEVKREIRELQTVVAVLESDLTSVVHRHQELRQSIAHGQAELDSARTEAHDAEITIVKADKDLRRAEEEHQRAVERAAKLAEEHQELSLELEAAGDEESTARTEIESATVARDEAQTELDAAESVEEQRRMGADEQNMLVTEVRVRAAQSRQKAESDRSTVERLDRSVVELGGRIDRLSNEVQELSRLQGELGSQLVVNRAALEERVTEAMFASELLQTVRQEYDAAKEAIGIRELAIRELRSVMDAAMKRENELNLRERELSMALEHLVEQINERHRLDLRRVLGDYHLREIPDGAVRERIDELLRLVERMGEINLTAIEEFDEQSKRFEYLSGQKKDLEDALSQLERAIRDMNRESRRMFKETFEAVNERFKVVFPTMFGGGKAELKLTNPEDMLETGIDIVAQPPGKRLGSIELMSGGEKALTAVSLIFAIFQCKPSPFCLLDEVDAPLDEANIARYNQAIRQMTGHSQFILISHSKRTMELSDVLYGVTMETPGISKLVSVELRKKAAANTVAAPAVAQESTEDAQKAVA